MGDLTRNFNRREFACKCGCGADLIEPDLVDRIQLMRDLLGKSLSISSGIRCADHNKKVGGVENSTHVRCIAVDVPTAGSADRGEKVEAAIGAGFRYIGIGKDFLHLALRDSASLIMFDYYAKDHVA